MSAPDARDPWWTPAPLEGPARPRLAALCLRPGGAGDRARGRGRAARRGAAARGGRVDRGAGRRRAVAARGDRRSCSRLWLGDGLRPISRPRVEREGDPGALGPSSPASAASPAPMEPDVVARTLQTRMALTRAWSLFLDRYPVLLLPVSAELPFPDDLDLQGEAGFDRVYAAQLVQTGLPADGPAGPDRLDRHGRHRARSACRSSPAATARISACWPAKRSRPAAHRPRRSTRKRERAAPARRREPCRAAGRSRPCPGRARADRRERVSATGARTRQASPS